MKTASIALGYIGSGLSILFNVTIIATPSFLNEFVFSFVYLWPILAVVGAILGIIAAIFVKRKRILSGVLFILAAVLNLQILVLICFVLAAVFALMKDKANTEDAGVNV